MKRGLIIVAIITCLTSLIAQTHRTVPMYTDDAYYWPVADTVVPQEPVYDKHAREFIFLEDTTQTPETVRMRIVER